MLHLYHSLIVYENLRVLYYFSCILMLSLCFRFRWVASALKILSTDDDKKEVAVEFTEGLVAEQMPKHVAVIMDGNRRWAKNRNMPAVLGHKAGRDTMKQLALNCNELGVKVLTVFAFSTENWTRTEEEVNFLMKMLEQAIESDFQELMSHDIRISILGDKLGLPPSLQSLTASMEKSCKANKAMHFMIAFNYGGRHDITEATKQIATKVRDGVLQVEDVNEALFEKHLGTRCADFPNPDLLIRTSGEMRISNFMLWQLAYSELYFSDKMFPDFGMADLVQALKEFQLRQRRFGGHKYLPK